MSKQDNPLWKVLVEAGFGPDLDTAGALLHMAAGIYVMEGHAGCAVPVLEQHLKGWAKAFKEEKGRIQ